MASTLIRPSGAGPVGLALGAQPSASHNQTFPLIHAPDQTIQHGGGGGRPDVLSQDQRLSVLLFGNGEYLYADVITVGWEITSLPS